MVNFSSFFDLHDQRVAIGRHWTATEVAGMSNCQKLFWFHVIMRWYLSLTLNLRWEVTYEHASSHFWSRISPKHARRTPENLIGGILGSKNIHDSTHADMKLIMHTYNLSRVLVIYAWFMYVDLSREQPFKLKGIKSPNRSGSDPIRTGVPLRGLYGPVGPGRT